MFLQIWAVPILPGDLLTLTCFVQQASCFHACINASSYLLENIGTALLSCVKFSRHHHKHCGARLVVVAVNVGITSLLQ